MIKYFQLHFLFDFRINNVSWMSSLSSHSYDFYELYFLGYGNSDSYTEMENNSKKAKVVGRSTDVCLDVEKAVEMILKERKNKIYLIGHS